MPWVAAAIGAGGSLLGGALGADAAGDAADAQVRAGREAQNFAYQQYLTSLGLTEPMRASGHQAMNELNSLFGYTQQPYQSGVGMAQQNHAAGQAANNRLGADAVLKMLKQGMSIKDIAASGSLKTKSGITARLAKHGVTPQQLQTLQSGPYGQMQQRPQGGALAQQGPTGLDVFKASPDYQFRRDEGNRNILGGYGAAGGSGAFSGNALKALSDFNQNLASGEFQNF